MRLILAMSQSPCRAPKIVAGDSWRLPTWMYPQIIQVMDDHFSVETQGFGITQFEKPLEIEP